MSGVKVDLMVAWAVPVNAGQLLAHLQSYKNTLSTILTLRGCHQFGKGEQAFITTLPPELIREIEKCITADERSKHVDYWESRMRCASLEECGGGNYHAFFHLREEDAQDWLEDWEMTCEPGKTPLESLRRDVEFVEEMCDGNFDELRWQHPEDRAEWREAVMKGTLFDPVGGNLIEQHFGLRVHTMLNRVPATADWQEDEEQTLTYLISPACAELSSTADVLDSELADWEGESLPIQASISMQLSGSTATSASTMKNKFARCIDILGLDHKDGNGYDHREPMCKFDIASSGVLESKFPRTTGDMTPHLMVLGRALVNNGYSEAG